MQIIRAGWTVSALLCLCLLVGCSESTTDDAGNHQCPAPTPAKETTGLPEDLNLESVGTVTEVVREGGFVNATAIVDGTTIRDLHEKFSVSLEEAGYAIVGSENEVIEADVFFAQGQDTTGGAKFIQTRCPERVRIQLFIGQDGPAGG